MKKYIICCIIISVFFVPSALIGEQKYKFVFSYGDLVSFNYKTGKVYKKFNSSGNHYKTDYSAAIDIQYFLVPNISVGGILSLSTGNNISIKYLDGAASKNIFSLIPSFGPVITWHYYFKNIIPFISFSCLYTFNPVFYTAPSISPGPDATVKYDAHLLSCNLQIGATFLMTRHIGIYIAYRYTLQYETLKSIKPSGNASDAIMIFAAENNNKGYFGHDNGITLGFRFYL